MTILNQSNPFSVCYVPGCKYIIHSDDAVYYKHIDGVRRQRHMWHGAPAVSLDEWFVPNVRKYAMTLTEVDMLCQQWGKGRGFYKEVWEEAIRFFNGPRILA